MGVWWGRAWGYFGKSKIAKKIVMEERNNKQKK
jgi:hypothetical protein